MKPVSELTPDEIQRFVDYYHRSHAISIAVQVLFGLMIMVNCYRMYMLSSDRKKINKDLLDILNAEPSKRNDALLDACTKKCVFMKEFNEKSEFATDEVRDWYYRDPEKFQTRRKTPRDEERSQGVVH